MSTKLNETLQPPQIISLAKALSRLGWGGLLAQVLMGAIPFIVMVYTLAFDGPWAQEASGGGLPFVQTFSTIDLLLLVFIVGWFFRYTRIAKRIRTTPERMSMVGIRRTVWIGLITTTLAILFSMLVLVFEVGNMLFFFLSAPQAGMPTFQTTVDGVASWVSAVDMINLMSLVLTLGGEILALIFGLFLLARIMQIQIISTETPRD